MSRRRYFSVSILVGALALLLVAQVSLAAPGGGVKVLQWDTMVGVPAGLTGAQSQVPLRGINGGGVAWTVEQAHGDLRADGRLKIQVEGLAVAASGSNPIGAFRAIVSCVTGTGSFDNVLTEPFPATTGPASEGGGNSEIETSVTLPSPCVAPIVFVTSNTGSWFASTGN